MPTDLPRRTWAEIHPAALRHNAQVARASADGAAIMAVVKADGYGHGLAIATSALLDEVDAYGVATLEEALAVRDITGPERMVMVLGGLLPDEREPALAADLSVTISSLDEAQVYEQLAAHMDIKVRAHLVIDTGMGRLGFLESEFPAAANKIASLGHLVMEGIATHFPSADSDPDFTAGQIERFSSIAAESGLTFQWSHLCNSAGALGFGTAHGNMIRPGLMLYGVSPIKEAAAQLQTSLNWRARITQVRDLPSGAGIGYGRTFVADDALTTATLAVGYGDGYPRHLTGSGAEVLISGQRCPILGTVTMDQIVADVSALPERPQPGDSATLLGEQGDHTITADELATRAGTIPWEILTGITKRVARVVVD